MQPASNFPEANATFGPPVGTSEIQVSLIRAFMGHAEGGSMDGSKMVITAWRPNEAELAALKAGQPVFVTFMGGLPPHFVTTNFNQASHPA